MSVSAVPTRPDRLQVVIAGAGAVGRAIATELTVSGHAVLLIDRDADRITPDAVPAARWLRGDACELEVLESIALHTADVVVAATGDDRANLVLSLLAKVEFAVGKVVARVNDPADEWLFDATWGVDVAVSAPQMISALIEEAVNVGDLVRLMSFRRGGADLVEVTLPEDTALAGKPVRRLDLPRDAVLTAILREGRVFAPRPDDPLEGGDELLLVTAADVGDELRLALRLPVPGQD